MLTIPLLLAMMTAPREVQPPSNRGEFLYRQCKATTVNHPSGTEIDDANMCVAYFEGFIDGGGPNMKYRCLNRVSYSEMVATYLEYMSKNPDYMKMSKHLGLEAALMKAYCFNPRKD